MLAVVDYGVGNLFSLSCSLRSLGAEVLDADQVYHGLLAGSGPLRSALTAAFGACILDEEGKIDRRRLADAVYPDRLKELEGLTHPVIGEEIQRRLDMAREAGKPAAAIDAIALFESGLAGRCDVTVSVLAPVEVRVGRIMARDGIDEAYARRRVLAQPGEEFYRGHSDYVLENGGGEDPADFARRALALFREILKME